MAGKVLTVGEAAEKAGTTKRRVLKACQLGKLPGTKSGWVWLIKVEDLDSWRSGLKK